MAKRVQLVRHTTANADLFQGNEGEITVDVTTKSLRVHDGLIPGGIKVARADLSTSQAAIGGTQDGKMTSAQATELASATTKDGVQDGRLDAIELVNTNQDTLNSIQNGRLTDLETQDTTDDARMTAIELVDTNQDISIAALEAQDVTDDSRMTAIELVNTNQDALNVTQNGRLTTLEALIPGGGANSIIFHQTTPPVGWTKKVINNKALRVVSGAASNGGSVEFATVFGAGKVTDSHILSIAEMPAHTHTDTVNLSVADGLSGFDGGSGAADAGLVIESDSTGGGGGHTHNLSNFDLQYEDVIIASKD